MTSEAQRVAIAEACRWSSIGENHNGRLCGFHLKYGADGINHYVPDYPNDLNSCADFEKDAGNEYWRILNDIVDRDNKRIVAFAIGKATAPQRCEAFVRWKGLWKD